MFLYWKQINGWGWDKFYIFRPVFDSRILIYLLIILLMHNLTKREIILSQFLMCSDILVVAINSLFLVKKSYFRPR